MKIAPLLNKSTYQNEGILRANKYLKSNATPYTLNTIGPCPGLLNEVQLYDLGKPQIG